jgi:hypothetical protein
MKFIHLLLVLGLTATVAACGGPTTDVEEDMPATDDTEMMQEETTDEGVVEEGVVEEEATEGEETPGEN